MVGDGRVHIGSSLAPGGLQSTLEQKVLWNEYEKPHRLMVFVCLFV